MKIKRLAAMVLSVAFVLPVIGCGTNGNKDTVLLKPGMSYKISEKNTPAEYYSLSYDIIGGNDVMPISVFVGPMLSGGSEDANPQPNFISDKYFSLMSEAGINLSVYTTWFYEKNPSAYKTMLSLGEKYGIGFYVPSNTLAGLIGTRTQGTEMTEMDMDLLYDKIMDISDNLNYRSFVGLWVYDEPFPHWQLKNSKVFAQAIKELNLPGVTSYCNIVGSWEGEFAFWNTCAPTKFEDYAKAYMEIGFPMLSATQYPYCINWPKYDDEYKETRLKTHLFRLLALYRSLALEYKVPAWRMMQAGGDWTSGTDSVGYYPDEGEFLYDINCSLAFGMKGIQYYTGFQVEGDSITSDGSVDKGRIGIFGIDGEIHQWYYYAKKAGKQVHAVDHVLMNSANIGVLVSGKKTPSIVGNPLDGTMYEGDSIIIKDSYRELKSVSGEAVIGCFDYLGGTALYVVNGSHKNKNDVTLNFNDKYAYDITQRAETVAVTGKSVTLTLAAGEAALVVVR